MDAWSLVFSPDGERLYGGTWFRLLRWELGDGALTSLPTAHRGIIRSLQFTGGGETLASISRQTDSAVYFIDPESGAVTRRFQKHDLCGAAVAVSPQGRYLATTSDDASVRIWVLQPGD
jgi:WD40 repeat protein